MAGNDSGRGRLAILGLGNVLLGDDALGPYVARQLEAAYEMAEAVAVLDVGTPGLDLTPYLSDNDAVIVIDTVSVDAAPGTLRLYRREQLLAQPPPARTSPHQPGLREALLATELTDCAPTELLLVGVVPQATETGTGLSPPIQAAVPVVIDAVLDEVRRLGFSYRRRQPPLTPDIWWEQAPGAAGP